MPRLIAFDLDGTLVDSRQDLAHAANQLVVERGGRPLSLEAVTNMVGEGAAVLVRRALAAAGLADAPDALARFLAIYDECLLATTHLYPGIPDVLDAARSVARVVVLTNKPLHHSERLLAGLGVRPRFDAVVGGDNPHGRKPAPGALLALMQDAGAVPAATLMIGDSLVDWQTAQAAGARGCLVSFGFGFGRIPSGALPAEAWVASDAPALVSFVERFAKAAPGS